MDLQKYSTYGVSGARDLEARSRCNLGDLLNLVIESGAGLWTGDAKGADAVARGKGARVVWTDDFGGSYVSKLAQRSMALVKKIKDADGCLIVAPNKPCPVGINGFNGKGSGSWATADYARRKEIPLLLLWDGDRPDWGWEYAGLGVWLCESSMKPEPREKQLSLF
jgi:hypothetical protein